MYVYSMGEHCEQMSKVMSMHLRIVGDYNAFFFYMFFVVLLVYAIFYECNFFLVVYFISFKYRGEHSTLVSIFYVYVLENVICELEVLIVQFPGINLTIE